MEDNIGRVPRRPWRRGPLCGAAAAAMLLAMSEARVVAEPPDVRDRILLDLSLDQLSALEVDSVAGVGQDWFKAPAELHVLTGSDIRRSGHRSIAEALRMVPGMFVGRGDANTWSIAARGFNGGLGNKSLVMIDGRTVYDPLFSGTFWDIQDVLMEDLDRIEVINGPGATLWGANAVNGVINVTTRSAKETQGIYLSGGYGDEHRGFGAMRYGGRLSDDGWFRVWGKYRNRDSFEDADGNDAGDDWDLAHGGFRTDIEASDGLSFTFQVELYGSDRIGERTRTPVPDAHLLFTTSQQDGRAEGGHLLARVRKEIEPGSGWTLQAYYDRTERVTGNGFEVSRDTADIDFRHFFTLGDHQAIIWGVAARHTSDRTRASTNIAYDPRSRSMDTVSAFIQDTFTIVPDKVFLMVGSKFEHNDTTGFEVQPSVRAWFTPDDRNTLWAGVSRPVRTPSRTEDDTILTLGIADTGLLAGGAASGVFIPLNVTGDDDVEAENVLVFEGGYRSRLNDRMTLDLAVFLQQYDDLIFVPAATVGSFNNDGDAESYGATISLDWRVSETWRLVAAYSFTDVQVHGPVANSDEGSTPQHMAQIRSYLDITPDIELNAALYYVDSLPQQNVKSYLRFDLGVTWRVNDHVELSIFGQNLLDPGHREFSTFEVPRGVYGQVTLRF